MSEEHPHGDDENESGIKTPKQLITVIAAAIIVPVIVIVLLTQFVTLDNKQSPGNDALSPAAVTARIAPVASDAVFDSAAPVVYKTGQQVFEAQCTNCHLAGMLGAPKFGDAGAWGPRIAQGYATLLNSALHGKGNMTAQGGGDYSDYEVGRAVVYMANKGGAHFEDPAAPAAASAPAPAASGAVAPAASASSTAASAAASSPASAASK